MVTQSRSKIIRPIHQGESSDTALRHIFLHANFKVSAVYIGENRIFNNQFDFKSV